MKQYCLYVICKGGEPYIMQTFNSFEKAKFFLYDLVKDKKYKLKNFIYYVDNDFYQNEYPLGLPSFWYFQIRVRNVELTDWVKYEVDKKEQKKNKVINFSKYLDIV